MKRILLLSTCFLVGCAHGAFGASDEAVQQKQDDVLLDNDVESASTAPAKSNAAAKTEVSAKPQPAVSAANLSKAIEPEVLQRMPLISDAKTLVYVNTVAQYIAQELVPSLRCASHGVTAADVRVAVVKSTTSSSFSLPGGPVFVTTALMQKMTSEDELAGVIANEIVTAVCQKSVPPDLASQAPTHWLEYVTQLPIKPLSRNDLAFADRYALVTLYRRGYDIEPYVKFIAKNETSGRHMWGEERATVLEKSVKATPKITSTASARAPRFKAAKAKSI